jgi:hypothetical protein
MVSNIVKFPYSASRCIHSRKPRTSKNGTPEERAAKVAAKSTPAAAVEISRGTLAYVLRRAEMDRRTATSRYEHVPEEIQAAQRPEIERLYYELDPKLRPVVLCYLRHLADGGAA